MFAIKNLVVDNSLGEKQMNNFKKSNQTNNIIQSKLATFKDCLQKIDIGLDASVLEFRYTIENYLNTLELIKNSNVNYLYNKSETLPYMEDFIHVVNVGKAILNSILDGLEQQYLNNKKIVIKKTENKMACF